MCTHAHFHVHPRFYTLTHNELISAGSTEVSGQERGLSFMMLAEICLCVQLRPHWLLGGSSPGEDTHPAA